MTTSENLLAKKKIIGVDLDGVIANFNPSYIRLLSKLSGQHIPPVDPETYEPQEWSYEAALGFTQDTVAATWKYITVDPLFWASLSPYPGVERFLDALKRSGHDIYFITSRPGLTAKRQTESWLRAFFENPTVLLTSKKGLACRTLGVDIYIDDRIENCLDVATTAGSTVYMPRRGWNRIATSNYVRINEVYSIYEMLDAEAIPYEQTRTTSLDKAA